VVRAGEVRVLGEEGTRNIPTDTSTAG